MVYSSETGACSTLSNKKTIIALENTLCQSISNLKELALEFEQLQLESEDYKAQALSLKGKCESKVCIGSEALKKVIELKDNIIQSVASALTRLNETKDMSIIDEAFKILCCEPVTLTPPKDNGDIQLKTPKIDTSPSYTEPCNDESVSEIEGTPTGRTSPIILSRKARNAAASDNREKKKCPDNWPTPKTKAVKLSFPGFSTPQGKTGKGKLRQMRFTTVKQNSVLDITSASEFFGLNGTKDTKSMQLNVKRESLDDEDTIEPSPTSVTSNFSSIYRSAAKSSPLKTIKDSPNKKTKGSPAKLSLIKKTINKLQIKTEDTSKYNTENVENKLEHSDFKMEESINLLRPPIRFRTPERTPAKLKDPDETECNIDSSMSLLHPANKLKKVSPDLKKNVCRFRTPERSPAKLKDPDETECNIDSSMSLLHPANKLEKVSPDLKKNVCSPSKRPLAENINITNLQTQCDTESSISLLNNGPPDIKKEEALEAIMKKDLERLETKRDIKVDAVFKEPTVRKKAEKMALPGWFCDECEHFFGDLYKDDPEMLAKKMQECSRHRGRQNPVRPKTPPGFWQPRWDVPTDTEEFNRRNNAV